MQTKSVGYYSAIKHGERGLVLHLPQSFVKANDLNPGSPIHVMIVDGNDRYLLLEAEEEEA